MRRSSSLAKIVVLLLTMILCACAADDSAGKAEETLSPHVEGEILVGMQAESGARRASSAGDLLPGGRELERITVGGPIAVGSIARAEAGSEPIPALEVLRLQLPPGMTVTEAMTHLSVRSDLLYAAPNYLVHKSRVPNDPSFIRQWGLQNPGGIHFSGSYGTFVGPGPDIGAATAWEVTTGSADVVVATVDTGIEYDHPDLAANIWNNPGETGLDSLGNDKKSNHIDDDGNGLIDDWRGWNFVANSNDPKDDDTEANAPSGHGSHVAGIIGAIGDNAVGISGINWQVRLMPLKFLSATGEGSIFNATKAINYAVSKGARIINASYEYDAPGDSGELSAIAAARSAGVLFVTAAGNSGHNVDTLGKVYPGAHPLDNILNVAASDPLDNLAPFSNYGLTSVDLAAPGVYIYSTVRLARIGSAGESGYDYMNGTSMAAPMVSGAAALVWARYPYLTATEVRLLLLATVDSTPSLSGLVASGGRLNLGRALQEGDITLTPAAPTNLTGTGLISGAELSWVDNADNETAYIVERALSGLPYAMIARLAANSTTYNDWTLNDGIIASYRLKAVAGVHSSPYSNEIAVSLPLRPPSGLTAYADTLGIHLNWTDASFAETGFKVERRPESRGTFAEIATLPVNSMGYTDRDVTPGGRYFYRVRSYSTTLGYSPYSNEILAQMAEGGRSKKSGCFIATAAYGTPLAPQVAILRSFRDRVLLTNPPGRLFVALYYRTSPPLADFIAGHDTLRAGVRILLRPLIWLATILTPESAAAMSSRPTPPKAISEEATIIPGELLVAFRPALNREEITAILQAEKSEELEAIPSPQGTLLRVKLPPGLTIASAQKNFSARPQILYAEPNRRVSIRRP